MKRWLRRIPRLEVLLLAGALLIMLQGSVAASPFGRGLFGADVPFGADTSLAIALGGNVALNLTPSGNIFSGSSSHIVTVTSTDVNGYELYVHTLGSSSMVNGAASIPASGNATEAALATNSWGYNTSGSSNYKGMTTTNTLLKSASGPYKNGDATTIKYGAVADVTKPAGDYVVSVVYTAVAINP